MKSLLDKLQSIDVDKRISELEEYLKTNKHKGPDKIDKQVKELKILLALKSQGVTPFDAFTQQTVPVIPAQFRAPIQLPNGSMMVPEVNELLRNVGIVSDAYRDIKDMLPDDEVEKAKANIYRTVDKLQGTDVPTINNEPKQNYFATISGKPGPAKSGFFQSNVTKKRVDLSGRSVISPNPELDMDQVEIPIDMGIDLYKPFIRQELIRRGYSLDKANKLISKKDKIAIDALQRAGNARPVLINRAPSISEGSITAHWPSFVDKYNVNIPNVLAHYHKGDFDGDCLVCDVSVRCSTPCLEALKYILTEMPTQIMRQTPMLKQLLSMLFSSRDKVHTMFIGDIIRDRTPLEAKPNEWGGINYKYKAMPGQWLLSLNEHRPGFQYEEWDEVLYLSVHTNIPVYVVSVGDYSVTCSPKNSILIKNGDKYDTVNLATDDIVGKLTPCLINGKVTDMPITDSKAIGISMDMYDVTLKKNKVFLADDFLFVMDTMAVHVPVSHEAINDAIKMMPSNHLYNDVNDKIEAFPDHAAATGIYLLSKSQKGRQSINAIMPDGYKVKDVITKPQLKSMLTELAKKDSKSTASIVDKLIRLGDTYAYETGFSFGLSDMAPLTALRKDVIKRIKKDIKTNNAYNDPSKLIDIYRRYASDASDMITNYYKKTDNPIGDLMVSKSRGSASQIRDGVFSQIYINSDDVLPKPIEHSFIEGLTPREYMASAAGARIGVLGRAQGTAAPGALGKVLFTNANNLVVNKDKGESMGVISFSTDNANDIIDRYAAEDVIVRGDIVIHKNTVIDPKSLQTAIKRGIKEIKVYSPLGSSSIDGGIPAMSYGIIKGNKLPEVGYNIGAHAAAGIVDPLYTMSMQSFHTGASLEDKEKGFPRLKQVLELNKEIKDKATVATVKGTVTDIKSDSIGGSIIVIEGTEHYVVPGNKVLVKAGQSISKGDILSSGPADPRDIYKQKGLFAAQNYMVDELVKNTPSNISRRAAETVVESITRHAEVIDPGDSEFLPGDVLLISEIEHRNKSLDNKISYEPIFKGVTSLPLAAQSWPSQLNFRNLKKALSHLAIGSEANIHSYEPAPALMHSTEFGKGEKGKY